MIDVPDEARRLCRETPLTFAVPLGAWLKLESLQATGSFKLRGAAVKLARLSPDERARGVVAASAGNHGLGVALAARRMGLHATVVVPQLAARLKVEGIERLGAEVLRVGTSYDHAERFARKIADEQARVFVSPFDDEDVVAGNGAWLGRELRAQRPSLRRVIVPVGGGGLSGGLGRELGADVEVLGVQPRVNCAMHDSLRDGRAHVSYAGGATLCDGLEGAVAERTYDLARSYVRRIVLVEEEQVLRAMAFAYRALGLVVEPSAAVGIAAAQAGLVPVDDETAIIISGSNVDPEILDRALAAA
jgi:threonine dehydratase